MKGTRPCVLRQIRSRSESGRHKAGGEGGMRLPAGRTRNKRVMVGVPWSEAEITQHNIRGEY